LGENISTEADRIRRMIDTLIEWSRFETGKRELRWEWHLVEDLVGSAIRRLGSLLDDHQVVVTIEPDLAFVRGDEVLIETVLINLLDNAAHCTPAGGPVEVRVCADDQQCRVEVLDGGPRFDNEEDVLVDARSSARSGQTSTPGGALGLVVSRRIVDAHDGEIWARNRQDQTGAVFAFVLGYGGRTPPHDLVDPETGKDATE
jgi:two-component system sensor histidine kinase KdpD